MTATNKGPEGRRVAFKEADARARKEQRSIAVRVTKYGIWFCCMIEVALRPDEREEATIHCDGQIVFTDRFGVERDRPTGVKNSETITAWFTTPEQRDRHFAALVSHDDSRQGYFTNPKKVER